MRANIVVGASGATYEGNGLTFVARVPTLPDTGSSSTPMMVPMALAMIPAGVLAMWWAGRRRRVN